LILGIKFLTT